MTVAPLLRALTTACVRPMRAQGVWDQIDMNVLPLECSYNACGRCYKYGQFPCAWCGVPVALRMACRLIADKPVPCRYKVLFIVVGLIGQFFTRGLYSDSEVTYARRGGGCPCCGGRLKPVPGAQSASTDPRPA